MTRSRLYRGLAVGCGLEVLYLWIVFSTGGQAPCFPGYVINAPLVLVPYLAALGAPLVWLAIALCWQQPLNLTWILAAHFAGMGASYLLLPGCVDVYRMDRAPWGLQVEVYLLLGLYGAAMCRVLAQIHWKWGLGGRDIVETARD